MSIDPRRLYREIVDNEKQLRDLLRLNPSNTKDATILRGRLAQKARVLTELHAPFAASKEIEQLLWKPCFYKRIEEFRRRIRKYAAASSSDRSIREHFFVVSKEFQLFLSDSCSFYDHLRQCYALSLASSLPPPSETMEITRSLHRCLVFLGDLQRYKELHSQKAKKNFAQAENFYLQALQLLPHNGNPHNQLAVLATYIEAEAVAVYRYCRSLLIQQPFATAEENLVLLFERIRQKPLANIPHNPTPTPSHTSTSKDKAMAAKVFIDKLLRLLGTVYSMATQTQNQTQNQNQIRYPMEMETLVLEELNTLLLLKLLGEALVLKLVVINIFCIERALASSNTGNGTTALVHGVRLGFSLVDKILAFLLDKMEEIEGDTDTKWRLLAPILVFCEYLRWNPRVLASLVTINQANKRVELGFLTNLTQFLQHPKVVAILGGNLEQKGTEKQILLKELVELNGFSPLAPLYQQKNKTIGDEKEKEKKKQPLAETEALKVRVWKLHKFAGILCTTKPPLLYQGVGEKLASFSIEPVLFMASREPVQSMSLYDLGLVANENEEEEAVMGLMDNDYNEEEGEEEEVIVFQPSPALIGAKGGGVLPGSSALGGETNAVLAPSLADRPLSSGSTSGRIPPALSLSLSPPPRSVTIGSTGSNLLLPPSSFGKSGGERASFRASSIGSSLGYPNFHSFSDFGSSSSAFDSSPGLLSGWGRSLTSSASASASPVDQPPRVDDVGSGYTHAGMADLAAVERESALYQREVSSLSAFLNPPPGMSGGPRPQRTPPGLRVGGAGGPQRTTPPPPGFDGSGGVAKKYYTKNPFIVGSNS